jgi:hypothetical protein
MFSAFLNNLMVWRHCLISVYGKLIKAARYLGFMKKAHKSTVQFYFRHKAKLVN